MKKLIITADDYGMSRGVNDAIEAGIDAGLITSTNVMTNMPFYKEAIKLKNNPNVSVGIHWVLACGKSILPKNEIPTLVDENGNFYQYKEFCKRLKKKQISFEDIKKELLAQYQLYYDLMGEPDYWNTHQNTHVSWGIYGLFVQVARELNIKQMRSHQRIYVPSKSSNDKSLLWHITEPIKKIIIDLWQHNAHKKGISSPDGVVVCLSKQDSNNPEYVFNNIKWNKKTVGEFVIHPAKENDSAYFGNLIERRFENYKMFTNEKTKEAIEKAGIRLVTFNY